MKQTRIIIALLAISLTFSCSKKVPEIANTIPDHAFLVVTMHPKQMYDKGQIGSMENVIEKIDNEVVKAVLKDPTQSGVVLDEYAYVYIYFIDDEAIIGTTAALKDRSKFTSMIDNLVEGESEEIIEHKGYSMITPENDNAAMAWNDDQVILLASPEHPMSATEWQEELVGLYELEKENAVTSIVDFVDFSGKMEDLNVWFTGDELQKILEKSGAMDKMDIQLPMQLYNNYGQAFVEFADGAMYVTSETHFSDDVTKAASSVMVAKEELNRDLLDLTPGNDLLLAMAFSVEIDKLVDLVKGASPPGMDGMSDQIEQTTGVSGDEILDALNGDFVIAVNGAGEGSAMPVEVLIGIGLDDESLQEKMMGTVGNMADVQKEGDFFMINANGMELYSGIVDNIWVITNVSGYKDAVTGSGLEKTLLDSRFSDYANGSMGMYMNLDISTYPAALQSMLSQGGAPPMLTQITESFSYLGMEASNEINKMTLKTAHDDENSLYTLLQIADKSAK